MDCRIEERIPAIRSLDGLHDAPLTRFLDEKAKGIIQYAPLNAVADGERMHSFNLNRIGQRKLPECHGEGANAPLSERSVGKRVRNLNPRICKDVRLLDESSLCIC